MGIHKMHVTRCANRLSQLLAESDDSFINLVQLVHVLEGTFAQHKGVVARGLDLKVVIE